MLHIHKIYRFTFLNILSIGYLIKELYMTAYTSLTPTLPEEEKTPKPKQKTKPSLLCPKSQKQLKFDKALITFALIFPAQKDPKNLHPDPRDDKYPYPMYDDLLSHCHPKDPQYKTLQFQIKESFRNLDQGCIFTDFGVNDVSVRVKQDNVGSLIGFCLSSNIYFDGLVFFNYLNLKNKFLVQRDTMNITRVDNDQVINLTSEDKTDVFNGQVPALHIEKELQKGNKENFIFTFSNYKHSDLKMYIEVDGKKEEFMNSQNTKYYNTPPPPKEDPHQPPKMTEMKDTPFDFLKFSETKTSDNLLEFLNLIGNESQRGTKTVLKFLRKERDYTFETTADHIDYEVKAYFPLKFEALRRYYCGKYSFFINSICSTMDWDSSGGKSGASFLKSSCQKYVLKEVKKQEMKMFTEIENLYFDYLCKSFFNYYPTALAKILGAYKIRIKNRTKNETKTVYFFLQENLFVSPKPGRQLVYDLKGSKRNRWASLQKKVLLDTNFLFDFDSMPLTLDYPMKNIMNKCFINDSNFLSKCSIVDYSVLLIINLDDHSFRVGVIDYIQQYTLYKLLETTFKKAVGKDDPTIIGPLEYKKRFLKALNKYFIGLYEEKGTRMAIENGEIEEIAEDEEEDRVDSQENEPGNDSFEATQEKLETLEVPPMVKAKSTL